MAMPEAISASLIASFIGASVSSLFWWLRQMAMEESKKHLQIEIQRQSAEIAGLYTRLDNAHAVRDYHRRRG